MVKLFGREVNVPKIGGGSAHRRARSDDAGGPSKFMAVFDKRLNRYIMCGVIGLLLLINFILAIVAVRGTSELNGPLALQIVFTIVTAVNLGFVVWRPVSELGAKKKCWIYLTNSVSFALVWAIAFLYLAIRVGQAGNNDDDNNNNDANNNNNNNNNPAVRFLLARQDNANNPPANQDQNQPQNPEPNPNRAPVENGCIVLSLFFAFFFIFNTVYIYIRMRHLYPKYAEVVRDDSAADHAFSSRMNDADGDGIPDDEEHGVELKDNRQNTTAYNTSFNARRPGYDEDDDFRNDSYGAGEGSSRPAHYDPLGDNHNNNLTAGGVTPPDRTGYTPSGYMHETEYRPAHHAGGGAAGGYGQGGQGEDMHGGAPPPGYSHEGGAYASYQDDSHARTGQYGYQR